MEKFVERQNIARFTTLLMTENDPAKRELLQKLLIRRVRVDLATGFGRSSATPAAGLGARRGQGAQARTD